MSTTTRKKTGGRVAGVKNKATLAREAAALATEGRGPPTKQFPATRAPARGKRPAKVEKDAAPQGPASTLETPRPDGPTFPRYKLARVDALIPYTRNARTHSTAQVEKIAAAIREFGWTNPILTDGKNGIVAGHGRLLAAELLAMDVVPTIELKHLSPEQRRAYVIADNRLALDAGWDDDLLRLELGELRETGFDLGLTGFELPELDKLFADSPDGPSDFPSFDETIETEHTCPSCGYKFSGGKTTAAGEASAEIETGDC